MVKILTCDYEIEISSVIEAHIHSTAPISALSFVIFINCILLNYFPSDFVEPYCLNIVDSGFNILAALRSQQRKRPVPPNYTPISSRSQHVGSASSGIGSAQVQSSRSQYNNGSASSGIGSGPVPFTMTNADYKTPRSSDRNSEELSQLKNVNLVSYL